MAFSLDYRPPGPVAKAFLKSHAQVKLIQGPLGSGKTVCLCMDALKNMLAMPPDRYGVRRFRGVFLRNTGPELRMTTIRTWLEWFPEEIFGRFLYSAPMRHEIDFTPPDGIPVKGTMYFIPVDREDQVKKLLSLDLSWLYINEAREIPKEVVDMGHGRVGRYPQRGSIDRKPFWHGVAMDSNAADPSHWISIMSGQSPMPDGIAEEDRLTLQKPKSWEFFIQPPALRDRREEDGRLVGYELNEEAENLVNLPDDYYPNLTSGKTRNWIKVYCFNEPGLAREGNAVHPDFVRSTHVSDGPIEPVPGLPIWIGVDFGLTPAATFNQKLPNDRVLVLRELVLERGDATKLGQAIIRILHRDYAEHDHRLDGDPAGEQSAQTDSKTPFVILKNLGLNCRPAPTNDLAIRIGATDAALTTMRDGKPSILFDPSCSVLIGGMEGGYQYPKKAPTMTSKVTAMDAPIKNGYSHVCESLQYSLLGMGYGKAALGQTQPAQQTFNSRPQQSLSMIQRRRGLSHRPSMIRRGRTTA